MRHNGPITAGPGAPPRPRHGLTPRKAGVSQPLLGPDPGSRIPEGLATPAGLLWNPGPKGASGLCPSGPRRRPLDGSASPRIQSGCASGKGARTGAGGGPWGAAAPDGARQGPAPPRTPSPDSSAPGIPAEDAGFCLFFFFSKFQMIEAWTAVA